MQVKMQVLFCPWTIWMILAYSLLFSLFLLQNGDGFSIAEFSKSDFKVSGDTGYVLIRTPFCTTSRVHCGTACDQDEHCVMFLFNNKTIGPECALYGIPNVPGSSYSIDTSPNGGWQVYSMKSECPHLYIKKINKCVKFHTAGLILSDGQLKCNDERTSLLEFRSLSDIQFMSGVLSSIQELAGLNFWIGALKMSSGKFEWISDATPVASDLWGHGQPDGVGGPSEDCVDFMNYALNDVDCYSVTRSLICEKRL